MKRMLCIVLVSIVATGGQAASLATVNNTERQTAEFFVPVMQNLTNVELALAVSENEVAPISERCPKGMEPLLITTDSYVAYMQCIQSHLDVETLRLQTQIAKLTGRWSAFFDTFCRPLPQFIECAGTFSDEMATPCTIQKARELITETKRSASLSLNYMCYNNGQRMAEFAESGGIHCISNNTLAMQNCTVAMVNTMQHGVSPAANNSAESKANVATNAMTTWRVCLVDLLRTCPRPEPANIVDDLFSFILNQLQHTA